MDPWLPDAPSPLDVPIPLGTRVVLDEHAELVDEHLLAGGSPWRLVRLNPASRAALENWRGGGTVGGGEERLARTLIQRGLLRVDDEAPFSPRDVDVVIPHHGHVASLSALLTALKGFSVTVVDDASPDRSAVARCCAEHGATLVRLELNAGPAHARNVGASAGRAPLLWFIDNDVVVGDARDVLARLARAFADPLVAAVAPRVRGAPGTSWRERFEERFSPLDLGPRGGLVRAGAPVGYVPSSCLLVRRDAFGAGFAASMRVGEDVDFVWRLADHGWLVRYEPDTVVSHPARSSWRSWWRQRLAYGESAADLAERHGDRLAPLRSDRWTMSAWVLVLLGQSLLAGLLVRAAERHAADGPLSQAEDPAHAARAVVGANMVRAGGPLARGAVRAYGPLLLLAALHPRLRRRALTLYVAGTAWRWRQHRFEPSDVPLALADDLAYGVGLATGAWRHRSLRVLTPTFTKSATLAELLGGRAQPKVKS